MQTTEERVDQAKTGDRDAMGTLVERFEDATVAMAWSILRDFHLAQDIAQDAFVEAFHHIGQLRNHKLFGTWLLRIARRAALRRKNQLREESVDVDWSAVPEPPSWLEPFYGVLPMLSELPEHEYEVLALRYLSGFSVQRVATETGRSVGTTTKQISRAIKRLQAMREEIDR